MSKKEDIITTALNLFNRHNYSSIGIDRIINESGVAKMTFYKYFPSKESLIEECLSRRNKSIQQAIEQQLNQIDEGDYLGKIKAVYFGMCHGLTRMISMVVCFKRLHWKFYNSTHLLLVQLSTIEIG